MTNKTIALGKIISVQVETIKKTKQAILFSTDNNIKPRFNEVIIYVDNITETEDTIQVASSYNNVITISTFLKRNLISFCIQYEEISND